MSGDIRRLIQEQVTEDGQIAGMLAKYGNGPAFFYQKAPSDSRPGWGKQKYPRADFSVDLRQDPERKRAGTLTVNIWVTTECTPTGDLDPDRAIEKRIEELLSGTFYTDGETTFCAEWDRSDEFTVEINSATHNTTPEVYGITMTFDLMEFPEQITTDPDPVEALNRWTKKYFPGMAIIGYDGMPERWKPTDEHPAIYWRFEGSTSTKQTYSVTWYSGIFDAHIIAESVKERNRWIKAITERMQNDGEILLVDKSPMFLNRVAIRHGADPLREGQLQLTGQYGVLSTQDMTAKEFWGV